MHPLQPRIESCLVHSRTQARDQEVAVVQIADEAAGKVIGAIERLDADLKTVIGAVETFRADAKVGREAAAKLEVIHEDLRKLSAQLAALQNETN